jgi:hypothetical protein
LKLEVRMAAASWPAAPPARTGSPSIVTAPKVRVRNAVRDTSRSESPAAFVYGASMGRHQNSFQPVIPSTSGTSSAATPKSWGMSSSARKAPMGPMKLRMGPLAPALKKGTGSPGL